MNRTIKDNEYQKFQVTNGSSICPSCSPNPLLCFHHSSTSPPAPNHRLPSMRRIRTPCRPVRDERRRGFLRVRALGRGVSPCSLLLPVQASMFGLQDHRKYLAEREFEAMKERIGGKTKTFRKVSCINASVPLSGISSLSVSDEFCAECKGIGADFARAYLSNVCVAKELHRNGLGYALVAKSKLVAKEWGISDLYVHVAVDNVPAKKLYMKSGFVYENDEPAWQARFLDCPRRILLWFGIPGVQL